LILASACLRAYAQEPIDNDTWKQRCTTLAASADAIDKGSAPAALLLTTRGIAGSKFAAIAHERGNAGQHYIACTLYYTAAIAEYQGNDGKVDPAKAHGDAAQGAIELKLATGQVLTFKEKVDHGSHGVKTLTNGKITPADIAAVFGAFANSAPPGAYLLLPPPFANRPATFAAQSGRLA
jgi:hypothetical protein